MLLPKDEGWGLALKSLWNDKQTQELFEFAENEYSAKECFPPMNKIFRALELCPLSNVKAVIIGQDPYHNPNQADGLAFSCTTTKLPPSLKNIYKAIEVDYGVCPQNGDLSNWAKQGVLLLNTCLSVEKNKPFSHANKGWEKITAAIVNEVNSRGNIVFMLWGEPSKRLIPKDIRTDKNLYLEAPHPSPLSAYRGFFECHHFKKANDFLQAKRLEIIDWIN